MAAREGRNRNVKKNAANTRVEGNLTQQWGVRRRGGARVCGAIKSPLEGGGRSSLGGTHRKNIGLGPMKSSEAKEGRVGGEGKLKSFVIHKDNLIVKKQSKGDEVPEGVTNISRKFEEKQNRPRKQSRGKGSGS